MMRRRIPYEMVLGIAASVAVHVPWLVADARASTQKQPTVMEMVIEVEREPLRAQELARESAAESQEQSPEPPPLPAANPPARAAQAPSEQLPAAAQAARTLVAPETSAQEQGVADFTLVQGSGLSYAGGTTATAGTSTTAVRGQASAVSRPAPSAAATTRQPPAPPPGKDLSRPALPSTLAWNCSHLFPSDPDAANSATVMLVVTVRPDGAPRAVRVVSSPGQGFDAAARQCALGQRYAAAADRAGNPISGTTPPITVRFTR